MSIQVLLLVIDRRCVSGHVCIVLEPVGSARLTLDDDLYYELCDLMYRSLFGVPDEITDMTRSLEMVET